MIPLLLFSSHVVLAAQPEESDETSQNVVMTGGSDWGTQGNLRVSVPRRLDLITMCKNWEANGVSCSQPGVQAKCENVYCSSEQTSKPVASKPVAPEPVASKPVEPEPVALPAPEPVASKPVASKPVASKPVASKPVASKPVEVSDAGCSSEEYYVQKGDYILKLAHDRRCNYMDGTIFFKEDCKEDSVVNAKDKLKSDTRLYFRSDCKKYVTDQAIKDAGISLCANQEPAIVQKGDTLKKLATGININCQYIGNTFSSEFCEKDSEWYDINQLEIGDKLYFGAGADKGCERASAQAPATTTNASATPENAHAPNADPTSYPEFMVSGTGGVVQQGHAHLCAHGTCKLTNISQSTENITWIAPHPTDNNIVYAMIEEVVDGTIGIQRWKRSGAEWNLTSLPSVANEIKHTPVHATSADGLVFVSFLCWRCNSTNLVTVHDATTLEYKYAIMGPGGAHGAFVNGGYLYITLTWSHKVCWVSLNELKTRQSNIQDITKFTTCVDTNAPPRHIAFWNKKNKKAYVACEVPGKDNVRAEYNEHYENLRVYNIKPNGELEFAQKLCLGRYLCGRNEGIEKDYLGEILVVGDYLYISNRVPESELNIKRNVIYKIPLSNEKIDENNIKTLTNAPRYVRSMHADDTFLVAAGEHDNKVVMWGLNNNGQVADDEVGKEIATYSGTAAKFVMLS